VYNYRRQETTAGCQRKVRKQFEKATERKAQVEDVPEMGVTERETKRDRRGGKTWWSRSTPEGLKQTREKLVTPGGCGIKVDAEISTLVGECTRERSTRADPGRYVPASAVDRGGDQEPSASGRRVWGSPQRKDEWLSSCGPQCNIIPGREFANAHTPRSTTVVKGQTIPATSCWPLPGRASQHQSGEGFAGGASAVCWYRMEYHVQ
jgi:hypothetical protein